MPRGPGPLVGAGVTYAHLNSRFSLLPYLSTPRLYCIAQHSVDILLFILLAVLAHDCATPPSSSPSPAPPQICIARFLKMYTFVYPHVL